MSAKILSIAIATSIFAACAYADEDKPDQKKVPAEKSVSLTGVFESVQSSEIKSDTKHLSSFTLSRIVPHGTEVKAGQAIVWFDTEAIDEKIKAAETDLRLAKLTHDDEEFAHHQFLQTQKLDKAAAERSRMAARQAYDNYVRVDRDRSVATARFNLKSSQASLNNALEELKQLEQMYKEDELTEESEEIVLNRAKQAVENAQFRHESMQTQTERTLKQSIPRQAAQNEDTFARAEMTYQKTLRSLETARQKAEIEINRKREKFKKQQTTLNEMKAERTKLVLKAPHDGIVYHGALTRGKLSEKPSALAAKSSVTGTQVLATIVNPSKLQIRIDVSESIRGKIAAGMQGSVTAHMNTGPKLTARIKTVSSVPFSNHKFDGVLTIKGDHSGIAPGTGCTVKVTLNPKN